MPRLHMCAGPSSYVSANPYSLCIAFASVAQKLGLRTVAMINGAGVVMSEPTSVSIASAFDALVVQSYALPSGVIESVYATNLVNAPGRAAWPYASAASLVLPRSFARSSCVAKSEVVKFFRWMINSENVRFRLCPQEYAALVSPSVVAQLGVEAAWSALLCRELPISAAKARSEIVVGGVSISTTHTNVRNILLAHHTSKDATMGYTAANQDEGKAMVNLLTPSICKSTHICEIGCADHGMQAHRSRHADARLTFSLDVFRRVRLPLLSAGRTMVDAAHIQ
jgi:hypothetical protein